jgi:Peptide N-acetyl-beta-D-glucosaminyl asparaginase amidase A
VNRWLFASLACFSLVACRGNASSLPPAADTLATAPQAAQAAFGRPATSNLTRPAGAVGSSNTITADMPVPRPDTKPCTVTLFRDFKFENFTNQTFTFTPPAACHGPWAKVVFNWDAGSTKGIQFDRTGIIWLGGAPIFFGTTAEPTPTLGPTWHVERDVTDLSALFKKGAKGQISLGNVVNSTYTGILYGTATVQFYPPDAKYPAPRVPDVVLGAPLDPPLGNSVQMPGTPMTIDTTLPKNIESAYLDVYLQSQNDEEQWFMCVPTTVWVHSKQDLGFCKNSAAREGEIAIDGTPAGIAPIFPWIYTGGLDPDLWSPIPGVQTLELAPYRVDLTPFAGVLSNGKTHDISVNVYNSFSYFTGTGDLLLYLDPKQSTVTGKVLTNTLSADPPIAARNDIKYGATRMTGTVSVRSKRVFTISGYVVTSAGKVTTTIHTWSDFENVQQFDASGSNYSQLVSQQTKLHSVTTTTGATQTSVATSDLFYPLDVAYPFSATKTGYKLPLSVYQGYQRSVSVTGANSSWNSITNTVVSGDTMIFNKKQQWINAIDGLTTQLYTYKDSTGLCYGSQVQAKQNVVSSVTTPGCAASPPPPPK